MRGIATTLAAILALGLAALPAFAQGEVPAFCLATDPADPDYDITDFDPMRDADDWCKLAYHEPHKARRQLSKAVALVRRENNPNRIYFDPKGRSAPGLYLQLLRPWMAEQNAAGTHDWRVIQNGTSEGGYASDFRAEIKNVINCPVDTYQWRCGQRIVLTIDETSQNHYQVLYVPWMRLFHCTGEAPRYDFGERAMTAASTKEAVEGELDQVEADCTDHVPE